MTILAGVCSRGNDNGMEIRILLSKLQNLRPMDGDQLRARHSQVRSNRRRWIVDDKKMRIKGAVRETAWNFLGRRRLKIRFQNPELWKEFASCNVGIAALRSDRDCLSAQIRHVLE